MKVRRYLYGQTNISQRQSQLRGLRSPQEAAEGAGLKAKTISKVADIAAEGINREKIRQRRIQDRDDSVQERLTLAELKLLPGQIEDAYKDQDQIQPDGSSTNDLIMEQTESRLTDIRSGLQNINDPKTRANAEKMFGLFEDGVRADVGRMVNDMSEAWQVKSEFAFQQLAFEAEDWDLYAQQNQTLLDMDAISQEQFTAANKRGVKERENIAVDDTMKGYERQIAAGQGEEVLQSQLDNPNPNRAVQKQIVTGIKTQMVNYETARGKIKDEKLGWWKRQVDGWVTEIGDPTQDITFNLASVYDTIRDDRDITAVQASTLTAQLSAAMRTRDNKNDGYKLYQQRQQMGYEPEGTKTSREHTDRDLSTQMEALALSEDPNKPTPERLEADVYMSVGQVGFNRHNDMKNASTTEALASQAEFHLMYTRNPRFNVNDGLSAAQTAKFEMIQNLAKDDSVSYQQAADAVQTTKWIEAKDPNEHKRRNLMWSDEQGEEKAEQYYQDMRYSDRYDVSNLPFYEGMEHFDTFDNRTDYSTYLKLGLDLSGSWEGAKAYADSAFTKSRVPTNINGYMETMKGGISMVDDKGVPVDLSGIRQGVVDLAEGMTFQFTRADGTNYQGPLELGREPYVSYSPLGPGPLMPHDPPEGGLNLNEPYKEGDAWHFKATMDGRTIVDTATNKPFDVVITENDIVKLNIQQSMTRAIDVEKSVLEEAEKELAKDKETVARGERFSKKSDRFQNPSFVEAQERVKFAPSRIRGQQSRVQKAQENYDAAINNPDFQ